MNRVPELLGRNNEVRKLLDNSEPALIRELLANSEVPEPALKRGRAVAQAVLVLDGVGRGGGRRDCGGQGDEHARNAVLLRRGLHVLS